MGTTKKKSVAKKSAVKKATTKKAGVKKVATKKATTKKATTKKAAVKKSATKKATTKKATARKAVTKKATVKKPLSGQAELGKISDENLQTLAMDIDRQMKILGEMNTRVLIAKDQLADFQENLAAKIKAFQKKKAGKPTENFKDIMTSIRETKDEAAKMIKESKALHETYEVVSKHFEKGRVAAVKEMKKAEAVFMEKLHVVEAKVVKKAGEIKKNLKK